MTTTRGLKAIPARPAPWSTSDAIELLGLVAQLEHVAFARLAADSALAPTIEQRLELSRFASAAVERRDRVLARITEIGGDPVAAVRQYDDVLDDFDARTQPGSWWERLLKAYVGYGVADDFCRLAAEGLDAGSRAVVLEVLDDASHAELAVAELDAAGSADGVLTARLALWGRRLVGEALGVVQRLLVQRPALVRLVAPSASDAAPAEPSDQALRRAHGAAHPPHEPPRPHGLTATQRAPHGSLRAGLSVRRGQMLPKPTRPLLSEPISTYPRLAVGTMTRRPRTSTSSRAGRPLRAAATAAATSSGVWSDSRLISRGRFCTPMVISTVISFTSLLTLWFSGRLRPAGAAALVRS